MNVRITFGKYGQASNDTLTQRIQFLISPVNEMFRSLHVLLNPKHHGQNLRWVLNIEKKLTPKLYNDLDYFKPLFELGTPSFLIPNLTTFSTNFSSEWTQLLENLKHMDPTNTANKIRKLSQDRNNSFIPELAKGIEWSDFKPSNSSELVNDIVERPQHVYYRFKDFIDDYYRLIFRDTLKEKNIIQQLINEVEKETSYLQQGFSNLIKHLQTDRIFWNKNEIDIIKPFEETINIGNNGAILLIPSTFTWPHLFVSKYKNNVIINYGFESHRQNTFKIKDIQKVFYALGDPVRLQLLLTLKEQPQTTQSLSCSLGIGNSSISRDLQILKEVSLISSERKGKYVFYQPTSLVTNLIPKFFEYLED